MLLVHGILCLHLLCLAMTAGETWVRHVVVALGLQLSVLVWRLNEISLQRVEILRVLHMVNDQFSILLVYALVFQKVLHFDAVHAHLDHFLSKILLLLAKEINFILVSTKRSLLR